ncbi:MAG: DNA glycosylase AlkZ-like family protein, partial [Candidatus Limnocylindria bacterium]
MSDRVLNTRQLNRALLARQLLLERSSGSLTDVLEQIGGLQTQYAPSGYIGLWSRMHDFERPMLTRALEERRAVQGTLMRVTIHTVSAADYWPMALALRRPRRAWWLGATRHAVGEADMVEVARVIRQALANGPRRQSELAGLLRDRGFPSAAWQ